MKVLDISNKEAAALALKHKLYVAGWEMSRYLQRTKRTGEHDVKVVADEGGVPVSVCVNVRGHVMCFTRKSQRREGYGSLALKAVMGDCGDVCAGGGIRGSDDFFKVNGVSIF